MTPATQTTSLDRARSRALVLTLMLALVATAAAAGVSGPTFDKVFSPDTIGPGSSSMLSFTITNGTGMLAEQLAFSDTLPAGVTLATPAFVFNDCDGTVSAPNGGTTVSLTDGKLGVAESCTVVVNVTSSTPGTHTNVSGPISSTAGGGDTATDDLVVDVSLPGFSKSFLPSTVEFGERSTLTFLIDNSANASVVTNLDFTDVLPTGMVVAGPANASTTCGTATIPPSLSALPGSGTIVLDSDGTAGFPAVGAGATCTVVVDVIGGAVGSLGNVSGNLLATFVEAGKASAVLVVNDIEELLQIEKEFVDDPVAPGQTVTLEFTITNKSRDETATDITFDDDLETTLTGLIPTLPGDPDPPCGPLSSLSFSLGVLTLEDGELAPETSCTFTVELTVDSGSAPGSYLNTTGAVSGTIDEVTEEGNTASDLLFVVAFPVLTKEFTDDPVAAGGTVTLEFSITNTAASAATDITFRDELTDNTGTPGGGSLGNGFLPFPVSVTLPPVPDPPCGGGSSLALVSAGTDRQALLLTGGSLAAAGMAGDSCTFEVTLDIPLSLPGGTYTNTTEAISATVAAATVVGPPASDDIVIVSAPTLTKEFTDDPVLPAGGPVTLEFNLSYDVDPDAPDATAIAFTDDLTALVPPVPGLTATSVDTNTCTGSTVDITTDPTMIAFSGGSLSAEGSCMVVLTLTVPAASPVGFHANTTSDVTATVDGVAAANSPAEDDLLITPLVFTKEFLDGGEPVIPGDAVTLRFTITNNGTSAADDATGIFFTDDLAAILPGTPDVTTGAPTLNTCGGSESGSATFIVYSGGSLTFGSSCTIEYPLTVPAGVADDDYLNVTSSLSAIIGGGGVSVPPATDLLSVNSTLLELTKEFTDDPVFPDSPVTLEFTLTNLSATETVTDIAFTDNLGDAGGALLGLEATSPALLNDCGGMATLPATFFDYSGGSLLPGASCTIRLSVDVPAGPLPGSVFPNTTSAVAGKVGALDVGGADATDDLLVRTITFSKSFDGPTTASGTAELSFTITNLDSANAVSSLAFTDDLDAALSGLTATLPPTPDPPCGAGSVVAGTSFMALTGGSLAAAGSPGDSCTFTVTVNVPGTATAGTYVNTTSSLFSAGLPVADPASANLEIEPPPTFAKAFSPDTIFEGEVSTLTFTIDNSASALDATALDFTDVLPAGVVIATPSGASTTCTGGTLTATSGTDTISYSGGSVAAGASCTVTVDVTSDTAGTYVNTSGDLTSSLGNSGPAGDTLRVDPGDADLELAKSEVFEPVMAGGNQTYKLTVTNNGPAPAKAVVLTDVVPAGTVLVLARPTASCSEAAGVVTCALGDLASGATATVTITVYVELTETPAPIENMATVTSDSTDPDTGNNDAMATTEVIAKSGLALLDDVNGDGFPEVSVPLSGSIDVLVKDAESLAVVHQTEVFPDGWALAGFEKNPGSPDQLAVMAVEVATGAAQVRVVAGDTGALVSTSVIPAGFLPTAMTVIPDDGSARSVIAVAAVSTTGGLGRVFTFDAADGSPVSAFSLHPAAWPVDLAAVASFSGDPLVELGVVWINVTNGRKRLQLKELIGTQISTQLLPIALTPVALEGVADCCGGASDELAVLGRDGTLDRARLRVVEADGGFLVKDVVLGTQQPIALRSMPSFGGSSADELVTLLRNAALRATLRTRDAMTGANLLTKGFGPMAGSVPLGLGMAPSTYGTAVEDLGVYWLDPATGDLFVTVFDGGDGATASVVPIP